jgi:hypothetical protein
MEMAVVMTETISTTNMTGLCQRVKGLSLRKDPLIEDLTSSGFQNVGFWFSIIDLLLRMFDRQGS